jgi:hypothetical protein
LADQRKIKKEREVKKRNRIKMKRINVRMAAVVAMLLAGVAGAEEKYYGSVPSLKGEAIPLNKAIESAEMNKLMKLSGRVNAVCQMKGCWMELVDEEQSARVTFKDYSFFVPKEILNKDVIVEGTLSGKTISEGAARHYAKDAGKSDQEVAEIKGDQKEFSIVAESVILK